MLNTMMENESKSFDNISIPFKSSHQSVLWKKVFLEISQNSQKNTCARDSFLIKPQAWGLQLY